MEREREIEGEEERGESVYEVGLDRGLVGVPNAVEESLPELLHVVVGDLVRFLRRKPSLEKELQSSVSGGLVAGSQVSYQRRASAYGDCGSVVHFQSSLRDFEQPIVKP